MYDLINQQLTSNKGLNLFYKDDSAFQFSEKFYQEIRDDKEMSGDQLNVILNYTIDKILAELYRVNQYYTFEQSAIDELKSIYLDFYKGITTKSDNLDKIIDTHRKNLGSWLKKTNPFAEKIYSEKEDKIEPAACFEYSAELQLEILQIDLESITEPVLDIGCGENAVLVKYLRSKGKAAYGIDRYPSDLDYIKQTDWLKYDYEINKWGTIISNLGFSNHFMHHHLREDGNYVAYAKKYMEILNSLKIGGSFHYAPDLPFIEEFLDKSKYNVSFKEIQKGYKSVTIKRVV